MDTLCCVNRVLAYEDEVDEGFWPIKCGDRERDSFLHNCGEWCEHVVFFDGHVSLTCQGKVRVFKFDRFIDVKLKGTVVDGTVYVQNHLDPTMPDIGYHTIMCKAPRFPDQPRCTSECPKLEIDGETMTLTCSEEKLTFDYFKPKTYAMPEKITAAPYQEEEAEINKE